MLGWLGQGNLPVALLFEGTFATGPVYLWTGYGSIDWNGHTWIGIGTLGGVSPIDEGSTVEARGITVTLSGIDAGLLTDVLSEFVLNAPMTLYLAGLNGGAIIADPIVAFAGTLDQPTIDAAAETATISINCENKLLSMNVAADRRYTADDQQRDWPGDLGMNFVNSIQEMTLYWGQTPTSSGNV